jgi:hypothetical protein
MLSLTLMSKGEKRICVPLFPSMPMGEIVGMFYRQHMLVIDGKNRDGKGQHDQQRSDNGRGGETMNVVSYSKSPMTIRYEFREE